MALLGAVVHVIEVNAYLLLIHCFPLSEESTAGEYRRREHDARQRHPYVMVALRLTVMHGGIADVECQYAYEHPLGPSHCQIELHCLLLSMCGQKKSGIRCGYRWYSLVQTARVGRIRQRKERISL